MNWSDVGEWVKANAGTGAALVGSLLTGNVPGAVAAGVSLVSSATGTNDPTDALAALQGDPQTVIKLRELANAEQASIRKHIEAMESLRLQEHQETQKTVRNGDVATDEYVRRTRPQMARQSWAATVIYGFACVVGLYLGKNIFNVYLAGMFSAPAWTYLGLRTGDKVAQAIGGAIRGK